jgi:hypothetical protein
MRAPEWRPSDAVASATRQALAWWRERFPRRKRPAHQDERDEFLAYAYTMRLWTPEQIRFIADSVLKRTGGHWPDHAELEAEFVALKQRHAEKVASHAPVLTRWDGREDSACPHCGTRPAYAIESGQLIDHWAYRSPACSCSGVPATSTPSLWLRGIPARPEDDPVVLAQLHRDIAESQVREWQRGNRSLASILREATELTDATRAQRAREVVPA